MQAGGGETVAGSGRVDNLGGKAGRGNVSFRRLDLGAVRAKRDDDRGPKTGEYPPERGIHEGAGFRVAEDEIQALDRIEQNARVLEAVGALDVERRRRPGTSRRVDNTSAGGRGADWGEVRGGDTS